MKTLKATAATLVIVLNFNLAMAQMIRNHAVHFNRHRVTHHHHKK